MKIKHIPLEGEFVRLDPLTFAHLKDLEHEFEPKLFDYYPKPYATAREFVWNIYALRYHPSGERLCDWMHRAFWF